MEWARKMPWDRCLGDETVSAVSLGDDRVSAVSLGGIDVSTVPAEDHRAAAAHDGRHSADSTHVEEPESDEQTTCPICLDPVAQPIALVCGHPFCTDCLRGYVRSRAMLASAELPCPCCKQTSLLDDSTLATLGVRRRGRAIRGASQSAQRPDWAVRLRSQGRMLSAEGARERAQSLMHATSSRLQLRYCPGCNSPVQKNGGCESMSCPCGARFRWLTARPVHACRHCHKDGDGWWKTCSFCSPRANAEKRALTAGKGAAIATAMIPVGAAVSALVTSAVGVGCAAAVTTATTFGPPALVWEGVRRARGKSKWRGNKLLKAAQSGANVAAFGVFVAIVATCGWESD